MIRHLPVDELARRPAVEEKSHVETSVVRGTVARAGGPETSVACGTSGTDSRPHSSAPASDS